MADTSIGVVVIGRNEGERLRACLLSLKDAAVRVYVDSGSTDDSMALAREHGFAVVPLDADRPFTAARARNAGIAWLERHRPGLEFVQTVDGDCEVHAGWLACAISDLREDSRRAVVFGRRRERYPDRNTYHQACDDEWDVPRGDVNSCGGDALFRLAALREVGGYDGALIAGEEPDLCLRLRQKGWRIRSNGAEMTLHDIAMDRIRQWWQRSRRTGYALAELVVRHGAAADPSWRRLLHGAMGWSAVMAGAALGVAMAALLPWPLGGLALAPLLLCLAQVVRLAWRKRARFGMAAALRWAGLMMVAKLAQSAGWMEHLLQRRRGTARALIEYKA